MQGPNTLHYPNTLLGAKKLQGLNALHYPNTLLAPKTLQGQTQYRSQIHYRGRRHYRGPIHYRGRIHYSGQIYYVGRIHDSGRIHYRDRIHCSGRMHCKSRIHYRGRIHYSGQIGRIYLTLDSCLTTSACQTILKHDLWGLQVTQYIPRQGHEHRRVWAQWSTVWDVCFSGFSNQRYVFLPSEFIQLWGVCLCS